MYIVPDPLPETPNRQSITLGVVSQVIKYPEVELNQTVYPEVGNSTATFDSEVLQYMHHNPRRPSQTAESHPAGRSRNRVKGGRVQDPNELDMSGPSQAQRLSFKSSPQAQVSVLSPTQTSASALVRRVLEVPTIASSVTNSVSLVPKLSINVDSLQSDKGEHEKINATDDNPYCIPSKKLQVDPTGTRTFTVDARSRT